MNVLRRHWYNVGLLVAIASITYIGVSWRSLDTLQVLLLANFVALLIHQFEEYGLPGGEPAIMNMVIRPSATPERYPLNQNSAMVVNALAAYVFYLVPVFFAHVIWLGIAPVLFGFGQFIIHGVVTNKKLRTLYNPGLGAVVLLHIPIGSCYLYMIQSQSLASIWDWTIGVAYMSFFTFTALVKMTYVWLADKNSPYAFAPEEMQRFDVPQKITLLKQSQAPVSHLGKGES